MELLEQGKIFECLLEQSFLEVLVLWVFAAVFEKVLSFQ